MAPRIRDLGITIGNMPTGPNNAITDVPGVLVGQTTLIYDEPRIARTGVTMIVPRDGNISEDRAFAGYYSFNGNGEIHELNAWNHLRDLFKGLPGEYPVVLSSYHQSGH